MRAGWEYKKLGEVCEITMGQSPEGTSINDKIGVEFHQGKTCFGERFLGKSSIYSDNPIKTAEENTVLLCVRAPVGFPNITDRKICIGRGLCALKPRLGLEKSFLFYVLLGKQSYFEKNATGSTFKAISSKVISLTEISLPPIPQQRLIVSELDEINSLLALKREQLKKYDELAQSLFYEMFGDPVENEKGWVVKKLGEVTVKTAFNGQIQSVNDRCWLLNLDMVESQTGKIISKVYVTKDEIGNSTTSFNEEYVLYSKLRPYLNKVVLPDTSGYCTTELVPIKPKEGIDRCYLCYLLRSSSFVNMITIKVAGAKMPRVTMSDFWEFMFPLPPLSLQRLFAQRIEQIEEQKKQISAAIAKLETLLASRMQYWFE